MEGKRLKGQKLQVKGANMHYMEMGQGDPVLFIHGMPTSSYLWRNIMPSLSGYGRCIAPDLIGMGQSDKPDIDYTVFDHIDYMEAFIGQLNLENITLVLHGWGSVIGFELARRHPDKIKAIAFYESHIKPVSNWADLSLPVQQFAIMLQNKKAAHQAIVNQNYLVKRLLPSGVVNKLPEEVMDHYLAPFPTNESRRPLWQYVNDLPLGSGPDHVIDLIKNYSTWLATTTFPKLMLYAIPGFITTVDMLCWGRDHLQSLTLAPLEDVMHFAQESDPEGFSKALTDWYKEL